MADLKRQNCRLTADPPCRKSDDAHALPPRSSSFPDRSRDRPFRLPVRSRLRTVDCRPRGLPTMERVAMAANACWFKSGDKAFSTYKLAMELTSYSGRPRILAVPKHAPEGLPLLVVQAEGNPARLDAFGPMMQGPSAERIKHDVTRWAAGDKGC